MAINTTSVKEMFGSAAITEALMGDRPFVLYGLPMIPGLSTENYKRACELYDMIIYDDSIEEAEPIYLEYLKMCAEDGVNFSRASACLARTVRASVSGAHLPDVYNWLNCMLIGDLGGTEAEMDNAQEQAQKANEANWDRQEARAAAREAELQKIREKEEKSLKNRVKNMKDKIKNRKSKDGDNEEPIAEEPATTEETPVTETPAEATTTEAPVKESETSDLDKTDAKIEEEKKAKADKKPADKSTNKSDTQEVKDNEKKDTPAEVSESNHDSDPAPDSVPEENPVPAQTADSNGSAGLSVDQFNISNFVVKQDDGSAKKETGAFDINNFVNGGSNQPPVSNPAPNSQPVQPTQTQSDNMMQPVDNARVATVTSQQFVGIDPMVLFMMRQRQNQADQNMNRPPYNYTNHMAQNSQGFQSIVPNMNGGDNMPIMMQQPPVKDPDQQQAVAPAQQTEVCSCGDPNCTGKHELHPVNEEEAKKHTTAEIPDPAPELSENQKRDYIKKHIVFIDGAHSGENAVTITQLNNLYSMLKSSKLKNGLKKFKSKTRPSNPYLYEVKMEKYAQPGDDELYDIAFECPAEEVDGHKAKIVVKFSMQPKWNDETKCYGSEFTIYRVESNRGADTPSKANTTTKGDIDVTESDDEQAKDQPIVIVETKNNGGEANNNVKKNGKNKKKK